jgi:hypothetical protein
MADHTVDIEELIAAMALDWIANGHAMIARGRRVLTILEFCRATLPEAENAESKVPFAPGTDVPNRRA